MNQKIRQANNKEPLKQSNSTQNQKRRYSLGKRGGPQIQNSSKTQIDDDINQNYNAQMRQKNQYYVRGSPNHVYRSPNNKHSMPISSVKKQQQYNNTSRPQLRTSLSSSKLSSKNNNQSVTSIIIQNGNLPQKLANEKRHIFQNGDYYIGDWKNGQPQGSGKYYFVQKQCLYQGQFKNGRQDGKGNLYQAQYKNGILTRVGSDLYQGNWKDGYKHGVGKYFYEEQNHFYVGNWNKDIKNGQGFYKRYQQQYTGNWENNVRNGQGEMTTQDKTKYKGIFQRDEIIQGRIQYKNGDWYEGEIKNGKKSGQGRYYYKNSNQGIKFLDGKWQYDQMQGKGFVQYSNGDKKEGTWNRGKFQQSSTCVYTWANGNVFRGWFKNGALETGNITIDGKERDFPFK